MRRIHSNIHNKQNNLNNFTRLTKGRVFKSTFQSKQQTKHKKQSTWNKQNKQTIHTKANKQSQQHKQNKQYTQNKQDEKNTK